MYIRRMSNYAMIDRKKNSRTNTDKCQSTCRKLEKFEARFEVPSVESHWPNHSFHWCPSNHAPLPPSLSLHQKLPSDQTRKLYLSRRDVSRNRRRKNVCCLSAPGPTDFLSDMYEQLIRQRDKYVGGGSRTGGCHVYTGVETDWSFRDVDQEGTRRFNNSFCAACLRIMAAATAAA